MLTYGGVAGECGKGLIPAGICTWDGRRMQCIHRGEAATGQVGRPPRLKKVPVAWDRWVVRGVN